MTEEQKETAWNKLSDEQKIEANQRKDDLIMSHLQELEEKYQELKDMGKIQTGFGLDPPEILELRKRHREEFVCLQKEYGLA